MDGGKFVKERRVIEIRNEKEEGGKRIKNIGGMLKKRKEEVVNEMRRGKEKKIIDYEMKIRERKVKVNIRNIMKKIKE